MSIVVDIKTYSHETSSRVLGLLREQCDNTWLKGSEEQIFQICDELIKNAVKSNYKFLLLWLATRKRLMSSNPDFTLADADEWLAEVFFCGENILIEKQLEKIPNLEKVQGHVRELLNLENRLLKHKRGHGDKLEEKEAYKQFESLLRIKRLARQLKIGIHFKIENSPEHLIITVINDSPILERDVQRINTVRKRFLEYALKGETHTFFIENLDTSGGGHGLGYPLMDSVLLDLNLVPENSLYLVSAGRTMVLLALPLEKPEKEIDLSGQAAGMSL